MRGRKNGRGFKNGVHWSQTPEGRKRMSAITSKRNRGRKRTTARNHTERTDAGSTQTPDLDEAVFAYALGFIESWLGTYAASAGVPQTTLASRVGKVLHSKAGR